MAEKIKKTKTEKIEREFVIPLREKCRPVPRYKKTPKAIKSVKEFIARHMQLRDRDLKKVRLDMYLNELIWQRGIKKPIHKVKVKAIKEGDIVRVYAIDLPAKLNFKKIREEKQEIEQKKEAKEVKESQKSMMDKAKETISGKEESAPKGVHSNEEISNKDKNQEGIKDKVAPKDVSSKVEAESKEKEKQEAVKEVAKVQAKQDAKAVKKTTTPKIAKEKGKEEAVSNQ